MLSNTLCILEIFVRLLQKMDVISKNETSCWNSVQYSCNLVDKISTWSFWNISTTMRSSAPKSNFTSFVDYMGQPKSFFHVYLKNNCPLPLTYVEWGVHHKPESKSWENPFVEKMSLFDELMDIEKCIHPPKNQTLTN